MISNKGLREFKTSRSTPHIVKGGCSRRDILDLLIMIECVSFLIYIEHHEWTSVKSIFKKSITFKQLEGGTTSAYKVVSSAYKIISFSRSAVYRMNNKGSKILP